jgi:uncharacterized protein
MIPNVKVFAIADIHLSKAFPKPMTVFGDNWEGHPEAVFERWRETVGVDDLVIVAGDISWAMRLPDALQDLADVAALPGTKVLLRGNHDYWWPSISRLRQALPEGMYALQHDSLVVGGVAIAGTRGWDAPGSRGYGEEDEKPRGFDLRPLDHCYALPTVCFWRGYGFYRANRTVCP